MKSFLGLATKKTYKQSVGFPQPPKTYKSATVVSIPTKKYKLAAGAVPVKPKPKPIQEVSYVNWVSKVLPMRCPGCFECIDKETGNTVRCFLKDKYGNPAVCDLFIAPTGILVAKCPRYRFGHLFSYLMIPIRKRYMHCLVDVWGRRACIIALPMSGIPTV